MPSSPHVKSELAQGLWALAPPRILESLLDDAQFRDEFGVERDPILSFGDSGPSFVRSRLYNAVRQTLRNETDFKVTDTEGRAWKLGVEKGESEQRIPQISYNGHRIVLLPHSTLLPDSRERISSFNYIAHHFNLPVSSKNVWHDIVSERPLDDDEVDKFYDDFCDTPIHFKRSLRDEISSGTLSVSSLAPRSKRYYERLVGVYDGSTSLRDYASGEGRKFIENLLSWKPLDGFLFSLLLSSHSALTAEISVELLEKEEVVRAFSFLEKLGDRISQLGAIEVGLRVLSEVPEIEPLLIRLIEQIRDENVEGTDSRFKLLSTLFFFVDGELSRTQLFSENPPYYRRLASLSQSTLICRQFANLGVGIDSFCEWLVDQHGVSHSCCYLQSLVDTRLEPRWIPEFAAAPLMRREFLGRILDTALDHKEALQNTKLYDLILGTETNNFLSHIEFTNAQIVGPLEGGEKASDTSSTYFLEEIEAQFRAEGNGSPPFVPLIFFWPLLPHKSVLSELAADALKRSNHRLDEIEDKTQLIIILNDLASVAAVTRSRLLADELRILVHQYRRDSQHAISAGEAVRVCLAAAASRSDLKEWREYLGTCLTELAFSDLEDSDKNSLHFQLQYLCHVDPGLWAFCSKAEAALKALRGY